MTTDVLIVLAIWYSDGMYLFLKDFSQLPPRCQQLQRREQNQKIQKPLRWFGVGTKILLCDCVFGLESRATKKQTLLHAVNSIQPNPNQFHGLWPSVAWCFPAMPRQDSTPRGRQKGLGYLAWAEDGFDENLPRYHRGCWTVCQEVENSNPLSMSFLGLSKPWKVWSAVLAVETFRASKMCMPCPGDDPVSNAHPLECRPLQVHPGPVERSKVYPLVN